VGGTGTEEDPYGKGLTVGGVRLVLAPIKIKKRVKRTCVAVGYIIKSEGLRKTTDSNVDIWQGLRRGKKKGGWEKSDCRSDVC